MKSTTYKIEWRNGDDDNWTLIRVGYLCEQDARDACAEVLNRLKKRFDDPHVRLIETVTESRELPLFLEPVPEIEQSRALLAAASKLARASGMLA